MNARRSDLWMGGWMGFAILHWLHLLSLAWRLFLHVHWRN